MSAPPAPAFHLGAPLSAQRRLGPLAAALAGHGLVLWGLTSLVAPSAVPTMAAAPLQVRWFDAPAATPPSAARQAPPPTARQRPATTQAPRPTPPAALATPEPPAPSISAPPAVPAAAVAQPLLAPPTPAAAIPATPAAQVVTAARFDADYLQNPAPPYPNLSRKLGEEGRVVLRAHVLPDGQAAAVEIRQSSGSPRLDAAALDTVRRWRFVPARQGEQAVASWVLIPISFRLES